MRKNWQFFRASDFQSLMYPCFTFCRIFGIFPYKINNSFFESSKPHYILSIIITCVVCVLELKFLNHANIFAKFLNFEMAIGYLPAICYVIVTAVVAIFTLILSGSRMRLLQTIMDISSRLSPESYQKLSRLIHTKDILGFFYLTSIFLIYYLHTINISIWYMTLVVYTVVQRFQNNMLYMNCVCILKTCFKEINNNLLHIQKFIVNNEHISTIFDYKQRNLFLIMNIKSLEKQHLIISNTVQMLNIIFSLQLLATIALYFFTTICELYYYIVQWHNGFIVLGKNITFLYLASTIYRSVEMMLLVWACETGKNEAEEIRTTIHDVINSTRDEQLKNELQLFSMQILHRKNIFSAKGVNMDAALLTTISGIITTFMLILLQFLIISHSCDEKSAINTT